VTNDVYIDTCIHTICINLNSSQYPSLWCEETDYIYRYIYTYIHTHVLSLYIQTPRGTPVSLKPPMRRNWLCIYVCINTYIYYIYIQIAGTDYIHIHAYIHTYTIYKFKHLAVPQSLVRRDWLYIYIHITYIHFKHLAVPRPRWSRQCARTDYIYMYMYIYIYVYIYIQIAGTDTIHIHAYLHGVYKFKHLAIPQSRWIRRCVGTVGAVQREVPRRRNARPRRGRRKIAPGTAGTYRADDVDRYRYR